MSICFCRAMAATLVACCGEPMTMAVFPLLDVLFAAASSQADTTDSMIDAPNRWKK